MKNTAQWPNRPSRRTVLARLGGLALALTGGAFSAWAQNGGKSAGTGVAWDSAYEMTVDFELNQIDGFRVRRPYVAVWIEDKDGNSMRTLALWIEYNQKGWRYVRNLRRWWRDDQYRVEHGSDEIAATVSSATRMPGKYSVTWNGLDNAGKPVPQGNYYVCLEVSREHGTYQLMWKAITVGPKSFTETLPGNVEVKGATIDYRKRK